MSEIKSYKVEADVRTDSITDEGKVETKVVKRKGYIITEAYDKSELDYNGVNHAGIELCDDDNNPIVDNPYAFEVRWRVELGHAIAELNRKDVKPHDFVEINYADGGDGSGTTVRLRVTALPTRPHICAKMCDYSKLLHSDACHVLIYGEPLCKDRFLVSCSMTDGEGNFVLRTDLNKWLLSLVQEKISAVVGEDAKIYWDHESHNYISDSKSDGSCLSIFIKAKSVEVLKRAMFVVGCENYGPCDVFIQKMEGNDETAEKWVTARLHIVSVY